MWDIVSRLNSAFFLFLLKRPEKEVEPSPEDRIRALRAHLNEIHQSEQHERSQRRLSARLSRLWNRSGPNA